MRRHVLKTSLYRAFNLKVFSRYESIFCEKLQYKEHGDPAKVVAYTKEELKQVCTGEVLVKMLAAPVHPVDINVIQGKYHFKLSKIIAHSEFSFIETPSAFILWVQHLK